MRIRVLFFGQLKDILSLSEDELDLEPGAKLGDAFDRYASRFPRLGALAGSIVLSRNHEFAGREAELADGDEIAFLPPVSGGAGFTHEILEENGNFAALTRSAIDTKAVLDRLVRPEDGAIIDFEGIVRNNTKGRPTLYLDYECYEEMAVRTMAQLVREIAAEHPIGRIAMVHRLGRMEIGEASVVIVVTSPHRKAAFAAALDGINRLKKTVPIWKKEYFADGEVWVEGEWDESLPKA